MRETVVFFGTGFKGHRALDFWKRHDVYPDYFCDNNPTLWSKQIEGIEVISPQELNLFNSIKVYITCNAVGDIRNQLMSMGIASESIIDGSIIDPIIFIFSIFKKKRTPFHINNEYKDKKCIFDFTYGTGLGGVQTWSFSAAKELSKIGFVGEYLMDVNVPHTHYEGAFCTTAIDVKSDGDEVDYIEQYIDYFVQSDAKYIICNFPRAIFYASLIVKILYKHELCIIAVLHNDEQIYYDNYGAYSNLINKYLVISERMMDHMLALGINKMKIYMLQWKIMTNKTIHTYSQENDAIRIGYAGRITIIQKRIDLLLALAENLISNEIDYTLEIAGTGESSEYLIQEINNRNLCGNVIYRGGIDHDSINDFWARQDVYICCSDYEGHSISQYEAMANGVIPVATDVSGVRDDIEDGVNGYVVPVGDIKLAADRICYLFSHREILKTMGERSVKMIQERNKMIDEISLWKKIMGVEL